MTHKCEEHRDMYCYECLFERERQYKKLLEFVQRLAKSKDYIMMFNPDQARWILEEIGESA